MKQSPGRHAGVIVLWLLAGVVNAHDAAASGPVTSPPPPAVAQPHLESPSVPEPRQIHALPAATSQLLWADKEIQVTKPTRLMLVAPHPDDETLAAGGLIQRVLAHRGQVRVVFVTNGDGYVDGVRWTHLQLRPAEIAAKGQALSEYQSQIHVMKPFLKQFLLPFELFGELDATQINAVPREYAACVRRRH
jgi:hypothetical protein